MPFRGSSRNSTSGLPINAELMRTFCFMPFECSESGWSSASSMPNRSSNSPIFLVAYLPSMPRRLATIVRYSPAVSASYRAPASGT